MPLSLIERCSEDSVQEFRASAKLRYREGITLAQQEHYTAAIYLWGYAAEMILKAAYFDLTLQPPDEAISIKHLNEALKEAGSLDIDIPKKEKLHNLEVWAELLVLYRAKLPEKHSYKDSTFGETLLQHAQQIYRHWRVILRYRKVVAEKSEAEQVQQSIQWFIEQTSKI